MRLDEKLIAFFRNPLMCVIAASDGQGRPTAGRGVGFHLSQDRESIEVIFSAWQWPRLDSAIGQGGRLAATFVSPSDYVSFQLKGPASLRDAAGPDLARAGAFIAAATEELAALGVARPVIAPWLTDRGARVARLEIREVYVQTPGPLAGMTAGTAEGAR